MKFFLTKKIILPEIIKVQIKPKGLILFGPLGSNTIPLAHLAKFSNCNLKIDKNHLLISTKEKQLFLCSLEKLIKQQILGVIQGFSVRLEAFGIGYKFRYEKKPNILYVTVGYSDDSHYQLPKSIILAQKNQTQITLYGVDKEVLNQTAATIQSIYPPEMYKGKGIRFQNQVLILKSGKKK
tara:strand:+ start:43 stop:585 length:543 start_codon:yes stop_codon:yes gene_type:complete